MGTKATNDKDVAYRQTPPQKGERDCFLNPALAVCHYYSNWLIYQLMIAANFSRFSSFSYCFQHLSPTLGLSQGLALLPHLYPLIILFKRLSPSSRHFPPAICILQPCVLGTPIPVFSDLKPWREGTRERRRPGTVTLPASFRWQWAHWLSSVQLALFADPTVTVREQAFSCHLSSSKSASVLFLLLSPILYFVSPILQYFFCF